DIFYKDPGLFGKQSVVDKLVDDLAATSDLDRSDLGVRASSKGLFAGSGLTIHLHHGGMAMGNDHDSTLIPCDAEISTLEIREDIEFVLIVEKEAVFQTLCRLGFPCHPLLKGPGILITGKGYPDVATRELVNTFSNELPGDVPILAVVDADPHGIEILSVFKYGSLAMDHQRDRLAAPRIQWIGVFASELQSSLGIPPSETIPLTKIDHKKVSSHRKSIGFVEQNLD
ncbi:endodeoxyribonuclease, partial [Tulasnella sp. 417]